MIDLLPIQIHHCSLKSACPVNKQLEKEGHGKCISLRNSLSRHHEPYTHPTCAESPPIHILRLGLDWGWAHSELRTRGRTETKREHEETHGERKKKRGRISSSSDICPPPFLTAISLRVISGRHTVASIRGQSGWLLAHSPSMSWRRREPAGRPGLERRGELGWRAGSFGFAEQATSCF